MCKDLVYFSATGVTQRIAEKLGGIPLEEYAGEREFVLIFPSYGSPRTGGYVPPAVKKFLAEHSDRLTAVVGVGNLTFGSDFCLGAVRAARRFRVPLLARIDMTPTLDDLRVIRMFLRKGAPWSTSPSSST